MSQTTSQPGARATGLSNRELVKAAQKDSQQLINELRLRLLSAFREQQEVGGKDDIPSSIVAIVNAHPDGILQTTLNQVVPDATADHRKDLVKSEKITEKKVGQTWLLIPIPAKPAPKEEPAKEVVMEAEVVG